MIDPVKELAGRRVARASALRMSPTMPPALADTRTQSISVRSGRCCPKPGTAPAHAYPPGPLTVSSSRVDSILPSEVQTAPESSQSVVAGSTMVTAPLPAGVTEISQ